MSGGVGPACDITLPKDEPHEPDASTAGKKPPPPSHRSFPALRQLNALAVAVVLSASGMVTVEDIAFVVFSIFYFYFISGVAFPRTPHSEPGPVFQSSLLSAYALFGPIIGLFLPIAYICEGVFEGDKEGIKAAAPHVFLLASQVFMEGVAVSGRFSLPVRVLVPVVYNSMRILSIMEWLKNEISKVDVIGDGGGGGGSVRRLSVGRGLAVANMAYWGFNLFGFVLPFYMPKAFKMYYSKVKD